MRRALVVAAAVILAAACGGGDDGGDAETTATTGPTGTTAASGDAAPAGGGAEAFIASLAGATCESFLTVAELEAITGNPVNELLTNHVPPQEDHNGALGCQYTHRTIVELTVSFTIGERAAYYDRFFGGIGANNQPVDGLGDEAFLDGPAADQSLRIALGGVALHIRHNDPADPDSFLYSLPVGRAIAELVLPRIAAQLASG